MSNKTRTFKGVALVTEVNSSFLVCKFVHWTHPDVRVMNAAFVGGTRPPEVAIETHVLISETDVWAGEGPILAKKAEMVTDYRSNCRGNIIKVADRFAFISCPKIGGTVFFPGNTLVRPIPKNLQLNVIIHVGDEVQFDAVPQTASMGCSWLACRVDIPLRPVDSGGLWLCIVTQVQPYSFDVWNRTLREPISCKFWGVDDPMRRLRPGMRVRVALVEDNSHGFVCSGRAKLSNEVFRFEQPSAKINGAFAGSSDGFGGHNSSEKEKALVNCFTVCSITTVPGPSQQRAAPSRFAASRFAASLKGVVRSNLASGSELSASLGSVHSVGSRSDAASPSRFATSPSSAYSATTGSWEENSGCSRTELLLTQYDEISKYLFDVTQALRLYPVGLKDILYGRLGPERASPSRSSLLSAELDEELMRLSPSSDDPAVVAAVISPSKEVQAETDNRLRSIVDTLLADADIYKEVCSKYPECAQEIALHLSQPWTS